MSLPAPRTTSEFRAFVRTHHPDVGGDPEVFAAGIAAWRQQSSPPAEPLLVFYRRRSVLAQLLESLRNRLPRPDRGPRPNDRRTP